MQWFQLRPTFEILLSESRDSAIEKLRTERDLRNDNKHFLMHGEYGEIHLPEAEHRLWSPHLSFYVIDRDGRGSVFGRFAPRINVWACVWCVYLAMAFTIFFAFTLAYSQWMLGTSMWGLWLALAAFIMLLSLYIVAHIGQQLSVDQMHALRRQLENIMLRQNLIQASDKLAPTGAAMLDKTLET